MKENGMTVTRACFGVIVKLSGLTEKLKGILMNLELRQTDFDFEEGETRLTQMKEVIKEEKEMPLFFKEWCNATKMRRWLQDKKNSDGLDLTNSED